MTSSELRSLEAHRLQLLDFSIRKYWTRSTRRSGGKNEHTIKDARRTVRRSRVVRARSGVAPGSACAQAQLQIPKIGEKSIGGVVRGTNGPEVGVWVIAETTELPTRFASIVVTDDQGRYLDPRSPDGELRSVGARLRARRIRQSCARSRASVSTTRPSPRRMKPRPRIITRRSIGTR